MKGSPGRNKEGKLVSHFTSESHKTAMMDFIRFTSTNACGCTVKQRETGIPFSRGETSTAKYQGDHNSS